jgi:hypothetical protein
MRFLRSNIAASCIYKNKTTVMKIKSLLMSALVLATSAVVAQESAKQVYESPKLKTEIAKQKTVAILPFTTSITYKRPPKNFDAAAHAAEEKNLTTDLQSSMYTYLLRKNDKYSVTFQDVTRTNALLKKAGVIDDIDAITQDSLALILGVDAVIKCKYSYEKTASEGGAIVKTVLFGGMGSKTGGGTLVMQIYNGTDGDLLWRFTKEMNDGVFSSSNELVERMMRKVARNFPYER